MSLTEESAPIAVNILTGFLGSGKTTLLRKILTEEAYGDTAVLINEFGEVGLDQVLVEKVAEDIVLLNSGCLCCTLRGELRDALEDLLNKRESGVIPPFKRIIIETTGLAKPALILSTVFADPRIRYHYTIGTVLATVDCLHSMGDQKLPPEWLEQIAAADTLVLTKQDKVDAHKIKTVYERLQTLNTTATIHAGVGLDVSTLFDVTFGKAKTIPPQQSMGHFSKLISKNKAPETTVYKPYFEHETSISTLHLNALQPIDWESFGVWLSMLLHAHGEQILRVKGLIQIKDNPAPVVIQGVQHVIYPPEHLDAWGDLTAQTSLVFIVRNLNAQQIKKSFDTFVLKKIALQQEKS